MGCRYLYEGEKSYNHTSFVNHLQHAIQLGFRFFDTAQLYDNEEILGKAWSKSGVNRSEFVFSSDLPGKANGGSSVALGTPRFTSTVTNASNQGRSAASSPVASG